MPRALGPPRRATAGPAPQSPTGRELGGEFMWKERSGEEGESCLLGLWAERRLWLGSGLLLRTAGRLPESGGPGPGAGDAFRAASPHPPPRPQLLRNSPGPSGPFRLVGSSVLGGTERPLLSGVVTRPESDPCVTGRDGEARPLCAPAGPGQGAASHAACSGPAVGAAQALPGLGLGVGVTSERRPHGAVTSASPSGSTVRTLRPGEGSLDLRMTPKPGSSPQVS